MHILAENMESRDVHNSSVRRNSKKAANYQSFRTQSLAITKISNSGQLQLVFHFQSHETLAVLLSVTHSDNFSKYWVFWFSSQQSHAFLPTNQIPRTINYILDFSFLMPSLQPFPCIRPNTIHLFDLPSSAFANQIKKGAYASVVHINYNLLGRWPIWVFFFLKSWFLEGAAPCLHHVSKGRIPAAV